MYTQFFKLTHSPFSIAPDPRFLFMSERHREALAHLLYGVGSGGFVLLTGEIGAGKTTVCSCFLEQIPENCNVAYIFNPKLTVDELLKSICDEFHIRQTDNRDPASIKTYVDALNAFLLGAHAEGKSNVLIIDEAQSLSAEVLEQLRLLTNLETNERKLLQIVLIGQPELRTLLDKPELRQLAQRIVARYHLGSLSADDTARYVQHRLAVAGNTAATPFPDGLMKRVHRLTQGVPRRINLLCDRALLGAYAEETSNVNRRILNKAAREVFGNEANAAPLAHRWIYTALACAALAGAGAMAFITRPGGVPAMPRLAATGSATTAATAATPPVQAYPPLNLDAPDAVAADAAPAYRSLARLWGQTLPAGDACASAQQASLRCYRGDKGFAEIRQIDRPVILFLHDGAGHAYYAVLQELSDAQAILTVGGNTYSANLVALERHFSGEFATFWKFPAGYREIITKGDNGDEVDWINTQLAKLNGLPAPAPKQAFDAAASDRIREFQSAQGLIADGVVGPRTFMQLGRAAGAPEPRLALRPYRNTPAVSALTDK